MRILLSAIASLALAACASQETPRMADATRTVLHDEMFHPVAVLSPDEITGLSPEMQDYLLSSIVVRHKFVDARREELLRALTTKGQLRLEFDAERTRTVAEAFHDHSGNCLSLTLMVGSMARALGLHAQYQRVLTDATWNRVDNNYLLIGHVDVVLSPSDDHVVFPPTSRQDTVVDFIPTSDLHGMRAEEIDETTVVAMFMNNRAVESLVVKDYDQAYSWVRASMRLDPTLVDSYNTLGVIYQRRGKFKEAEQAFQLVLAREPRNTLVMSNMIAVLNQEGRHNEADLLAAHLKEIEPFPAYFYFNQGRTAMGAGDYVTAQRMFQREVDRAPYNDEFHFWLARADAYLGDFDDARAELKLALEASTTRHQHDLYANKLLHLTSAQPN
jgi:tetratricopeptide (TPR) repeat protein